jgi:hypothetical protein
MFSNDYRLFYDCAGWSGPDACAAHGAHWVRFGMQEMAASQCVFATDYPQAVHAADELRDYVESVRALDPNCRALTEGLNAEKLIPDIRARIARQR